MKTTPKIYCLVSILFLAALMPSPWASGGSCAQYQPQGTCSPPCDGSCTYYIFHTQTISKTISEIGQPLDIFRPGGIFCDHEADAQLSDTMKQIPFTLGPHALNQLPSTVSLKYKTPEQKTRSGPPCPPPTP